MIFVSVGTHHAPFDRLVSAIDEAVSGERLPSDTVIQIGHGEYVPQACSWFRFCGREVFEAYLQHSDVVVTHGGIGTILPAVRIGKRVIAVPRLVRYGEHQDDHQLDICRALSRSGVIEYLDEPTGIVDLVQRSRWAPRQLAAKGTVARELRTILGVSAGGDPDWMSTIDGPVDLIAVLAGGKCVRHRAARFLAARFSDARLTVTGEHEQFDEWAGGRTVPCPRPTRSTYEDLLAVRELATCDGYASVVIVTSMPHGRRVLDLTTRVFTGARFVVQVAVAPGVGVLRRRELAVELMKRLYYRTRGWT